MELGEDNIKLGRRAFCTVLQILFILVSVLVVQHGRLQEARSHCLYTVSSRRSGQSQSKLQNGSHEPHMDVQDANEVFDNTIAVLSKCYKRTKFVTALCQ